MKTELRLQPHTQIAGAQVIELWWQGQFIGQVVGADGPGVRIISKHSKAIIGEKDTLIVQIHISPVPNKERTHADRN